MELKREGECGSERSRPDTGTNTSGNACGAHRCTPHTISVHFRDTLSVHIEPAVHTAHNLSTMHEHLLKLHDLSTLYEHQRKRLCCTPRSQYNPRRLVETPTRCPSKSENALLMLYTLSAFCSRLGSVQSVPEFFSRAAHCPISIPHAALSKFQLPYYARYRGTSVPGSV
eukprot:127721-Rhodomonas_salina.1